MEDKYHIFNNAFLWCIVIISSNFIGLYNIASKYTQVYFTDMIMILLFLVCIVYEFIFLFRDLLTIPKKRCIDRFAWFLLIWSILEVLYSWVLYSETQGIFMTIKESLTYIVPVILYFVLKRITLKGTQLNVLINKLIVVSGICSVLAICALFILMKTGANPLNLAVEQYSFVRNGRGHFMVGTMVVVPATIFLWVKILNKERFRFKWPIFILNMVHIIYVGQTRTLILYVLISLTVSYILVSKRSKQFKIFIGLICAVTCIIIEAPVIIESLTSLISDNSVVYRLEAIEFYLKQIVKSPIFGMGYIGASNKNLAYLLYGPNNRFFRTDVGFIGFSNCLGIVGAFWYISLLVYFVKLLKRIRSIDNELYLNAVAFFTYILVSSINLFCIDSFRIIYLSVFLVIGSGIESKINSLSNQGRGALCNTFFIKR